VLTSLCHFCKKHEKKKVLLKQLAWNEIENGTNTQKEWRKSVNGKGRKKIGKNKKVSFSSPSS
jgi:hypothetical protein